MCVVRFFTYPLEYVTMYLEVRCMSTKFVLSQTDRSQRADLGIQLGGGNKVGGMLFADDFIGVRGSKEGLQKHISGTVISGG